MLQENAQKRKAPRREIVEKTQITPISARLIEQRIAELHAEGVRTEYSRVLAREFGMPEAWIDRVVAALMLRHRSEAAALRAGVLGALDAARQAAAETWQEVS
jgi:3-oxoacyl-ACP reductase-like protein